MYLFFVVFCVSCVDFGPFRPVLVVQDVSFASGYVKPDRGKINTCVK